MPELPEVETVARALDRALAGRVLEDIVSLGRLRFPLDPLEACRCLAGRAVAGVRRRAKYILFDFAGDDGAALLAHLGMTGSFRIEPAVHPRLRHDRLTFLLRDGEELRFADARRFGFVKLVRVAAPDGFPAELSGLGPEPLGRRFGPAFMHERARGRRCPVKVFIMDQAVVVGVGNIYASEALFAAGIDPRRPASDLSREDWARLVREIKAVLRRALRRGGTTIRDYRTPDGTEGTFQRTLRVYGRPGESCPACGGEVLVMRQGGRSTFYCPRCQT